MTGGGHPHFAAQLYQELIKRPEYQTPAQRQELMRRLREVLFKLTILVGVCKTLEALFAITAVTKPEDEDHSYYRCVMFPFPVDLLGLQKDKARNERILSS